MEPSERASSLLGVGGAAKAKRAGSRTASQGIWQKANLAKVAVLNQSEVGKTGAQNL